jgi:hypothetical protein
MKDNEKYWEAPVVKTYSDEAKDLIALYDRAPGSSGPYCNPGGLSAVLQELSGRLECPELLRLAVFLQGHTA